MAVPLTLWFDTDAGLYRLRRICLTDVRLDTLEPLTFGRPAAIEPRYRFTTLLLLRKVELKAGREKRSH